MVVKFADTQKEKDAKRLQQMQSSLFNITAGLNSSALAQTTAALTPPQIHPNPPAQATPFLATDAITPTQLQLLQQLQVAGLQQQLLQGNCNFCCFREHNKPLLLFIQKSVPIYKKNLIA